MLFGLFGRRFADKTHAVYGAIVAQARQPAFYLDYGVPDKVESRFDMVVLHGFLLFRRMAGEPAETRAEAQDVLDLFFLDMDRTLREMGIGDISVPKKMKKIAEAYAGRSEAYGRALDAGDRAAFAAALGRNVYGGAPDPAGAAALADYAFAADAALRAVPAADLLAARLPWPDPAATSPRPTP
jgi:cytochrome b pre-mRNA-processing protein 3